MVYRGGRKKPGEPSSALEKALLVLGELTRSPRPVGLAELAAAIDLPRQTIHRILAQLENAQLILRAPQRDRYVVGPALAQLSVQALGTLNTAAPIRSVLERLVGETGETCNVGILHQDEIIYIERMDGPSPLRLQLQVGSRAPVHCTAIGKLLLANQHKNIRMRILNTLPLQHFTKTTLTSAAALEKEFATIRSSGYSFNNQEYFEGLTAIAIAIRDASGKAIAALAVHAPSTRMDREKALSFLPGMTEIAKDISSSWSLLEE
ncbi:transcriptional regulator KdgR [bacterium BMS3Bbin10]|nr:transcriptional regulator KdgR [bacterium BMS3Bbin10]